jgi:hypothetical protein
VVAAVPSRLSHRYGAKTDEFVQIEVGHASQNILLQAAALGLAAVPVGSLDPSRAADTLALPSDQTVLYLIPVGHIPLTDRPHAPVRRLEVPRGARAARSEVRPACDRDCGSLGATEPEVNWPDGTYMTPVQSTPTRMMTRAGSAMKTVMR